MRRNIVFSPLRSENDYFIFFMIKAVIFDYDGVIVDSFVSVFEVYKKICKHFNVKCPKTIDDFRITYGYNYIECLKNLGIQKNNFEEANAIYLREIVKMEHDIFADVTDVINELAQKYKLFLVSASHSNEILPKIEKFGLIKSFKKIYCGADKKTSKSDMIMGLLLENKYLADEIISIGDRAIDYEVSKKAGIDDNNIILVDYGWGLDKNKVGKVKIANNPKKILNLINKTR